MKKISLILSTLLLVGGSVQQLQAQNWGNIINNVFGKNNTTTNNSTNKNNSSLLGNGLSNLDISNGLKEALTIGANNASKNLSITDGFLKNAAIKILLPPEVQKVEKTLRSAGLGSLADNVILYMNRAAEDAASSAGPIFVNAIKQITLNDAISILNGQSDAATNFLKRTTQSQLMEAFSPVIKNSLNKVGATKVWEQAFTAYNKLPFTSKVNTDLTNYVTQKATDGMFYSIAQEEAKIRQNPAGTASSLIKKIFSK